MLLTIGIALVTCTHYSVSLSTNDGPLSKLEGHQAFRQTVQGGRLSNGQTVRVVRAGSEDRRYLVYTPEKALGRAKIPVVLAFHGGGGNPTSMIRLSGLNQKADAAGFVVVYPYGSGLSKETNLTFNAGNVGGYAKEKDIDDVAFTRAILDDLESVLPVDKGRVFATGISNGGMMCYRIASELADRIVAIAPVGGPMGTETCHPTRPVSVIHFHGTADELAPFNGGKGKGTPGIPAFRRPTFYSVDHSIKAWVAANGCDPKPKIEKLPDTTEDNMTVTRKTWINGKGGTSVVLVEIEGGGHTWPGMEPLVALLGPSTKDISANDVMWEFFQQHARP